MRFFYVPCHLSPVPCNLNLPTPTPSRRLRQWLWLSASLRITVAGQWRICTAFPTRATSIGKQQIGYRFL
jgi:hypothetical protein